MRAPFFGPSTTESSKPQADSSGRLYFLEYYWSVGAIKLAAGLIFCVPFFYFKGMPGHPHWFDFIGPIVGVTGLWDLLRWRRFTIDLQRGKLVVKNTYLARIHRTIEIPLADVSLAVEPGMLPGYGPAVFARLNAPGIKIALSYAKEDGEAQASADEYARVLQLRRVPSGRNAK